ncbi:RAVE protein 1 C terminal-domain-containing protein [Phlyctochytrium arcticum]|nr:RAVE protein 1 C terminal-domain-containing protein [Phlyctochytrium arcticum]
MQRLQQVVAGKSNPTSNAVSSGSFRGSRYIVYASKAVCHVYRADFTIVQTLTLAVHDANGDVGAVHMEDGGGRIAIVCGSDVSLFVPSGDDMQVQWSLETTLHQEDVVRSLAWSPRGELLTAAEKLSMWRQSAASSEGDEHKEWALAWDVKLSAPATRIEISSDGSFFASYGEDDRLVKVWYRRSAGERVEGPTKLPAYDFAYLPHPQKVMSAQWRKVAKKRTNTEDNVLMTLCQDNICRLWSPISSTQPFQFHLVAVIDPIDFPLTEDHTKHSSSHICTVHWLDSEQIYRAIHFRDLEEDRFSRKNNRRKPGATLMKSRKLKEALKEYPDMLFHVQSDGSMVVWGIQHLTGRPRRVAKVIVVMKMEATVVPQDHEYFGGKVICYHNGYSAKRSSIFFPAELQLLAQRGDGALQMYTMNLDDFFATSWTIPHLAVRHSWTGPRDTPAKFYRHPNENLIALVAEQGEILIYRTYVPQVGLRIKDGLTAVTSFPAYTGSSGSRLVAWLPCGAHMVLQEEQGLALHRIKAPHSRMVTLLDGYDPSDPLLLLHAFHDPDDATRNKIFLIGITKAQRVYLWGFEFQDQTLRLCSLISNSTLSHSITHALPSDDLCAVHYPEAPLGAHVFMTLSNEDRVARFWHAKNGRLASIGEASGSLWEIVAEFGIGDDVVEKVEADAFGKLAVVSVTNGSRQLAVWSNEATGLEMRQEWSMPISDEVVALDWYISSDGQHLLAVAFARRAYVYSQQRLRTVEDVPLWTVVSEFEVSWTESISAISWLTNGSLAIATGQKILVHEKWLSQDKLLNSSILPANSSTTQRDPSHIFSLVDQKNGRMPDHHPQLLVQHLLWGKFEFVKYSLSLLYHFVKRMVDAGRTIKATPMPLWRIFSEDQVIPQGAQQYEGLFDFGDELVEKEVKMGEFGEAQATWLSEQLTRISLPDITNIEQMALLAVIDTLIQIESQKRSLDENGIRYVLFTRLFLFARKTFPAQDKPESLTSRDSAWAFFSESQDNLLDFVTQAHDNKLTWSDAKALGIGYWLRSPDTFRRTMETIARNQYMGLNDTRNPVDCSLLYMALKKKNVVLGLWKLAGSHPEQAAMLRFLANNFEEDRWKSAALKNAFALLGKQRYEYATAFFLLADKLKDAMNVCLKQLRDPQLAIVICRLYEGENGPVQLDTITNVILPQALENGDRWLASMLFTMMKQRDNALLATLSALEGLIPEANPEDTASVTKIKCRLYSDPALLVLYHHLRRSYRAMRVPQCRVSPDLECEFVYGSAQAYERLGCPGLALDILQKAETMIGLYVDDEAPAQPNVKPPSDDIAAGVLDMDSFGKTSSSISKSSAPQASGAFDWGEPASVVTKKEEESSGGMDWGEPVSTQKPATSNSAIMDWGEPVSQQPPPQPGSGGMDWGEPVSQQPPPQPASGGMDWGEPVSQQKPKAETMDWGEPVSKTSAGESSGGIDWGEPISGGGAKKDVLDDEFEAFKKSMGGYAAEDEEDLDMSEDDEEDAKATTQTGLSDSNGVLSTPIKSGAAPILDERTRFRCELEKRNIRLYKWILAMRIVQAVYKSITAVAQNQDILKSEITFLDYFTLIREGIHSLCDIVGMPLQVMDRILDSRCREMEALVPQVELLPLHGTLSESRKAVEEFVVEECNTLTRLGLQEGLSTDDFPYVETLARDILWFLARWHLRVGTEGQSGAELDPSIVGQAAATAFVTWTLCAVRMRKFQTLYWLIGNADQLFSALLENKMDTLKDILLDLLSDRPVEGRPGADPDAEFDDRAGHDSEPEEEDFVTPDPMWSLGDSMLMADSLTLTISLQHVGMALDNYIAQLRDGSSGPVCSADDMHGFLTDAVLRKVSTMLYTMQLDVAKQWKKGPVKIETAKVHL